LADKLWKRLEESYEETSTMKDAYFVHLEGQVSQVQDDGWWECARIVFHWLNVIVNELRNLGFKVDNERFLSQVLEKLSTKIQNSCVHCCEGMIEVPHSQSNS
jgi:hypothetical protein